MSYEKTLHFAWVEALEMLGSWKGRGTRNSERKGFPHSGPVFWGLPAEASFSLLPALPCQGSALTLIHSEGSLWEAPPSLSCPGFSLSVPAHPPNTLPTVSHPHCQPLIQPVPTLCPFLSPQVSSGVTHSWCSRCSSVLG